MNTTGLIECRREDLLAALQTVCTAIERKNTIPILSYVLLQASGKTITVEGTDLDVTVRYTIPRSGNKAVVTTTLPAFELRDFCKAAGADDLWIKVQDNEATIKAGACRVLATFPPSDFPKDREYKTPVRFTCSFGDLRSAINIVKPAISTEDVRYYLNGSFFEPMGRNMLKLTATDGHRLHCTTINADGITAKDTKTRVIVPSKTLHIVEKWLGLAIRAWAKSKDGAPTLNVAIGPAGIDFLCGNFAVRSKIIDGTYPDYKRVIPSQGDDTKVVSFDQHALDGALKLVAAPRNENGKGVRFIIAKDKCELSRNGGDNKVSDSVACKYSGEPLEIGFNGSYVRDILASLGDGVIECVATDAMSPAIFRNPGNNTLTVLMPMRI